MNLRKQASMQFLSHAGAVAALAACLGLCQFWTPVAAQTLGGLGHPSRGPNDDAPRSAPAPPPPAEPSPSPTPAPEETPPPPEPAPAVPAPEPAAPAPAPPPEPAPSPAPPRPSPSENAPVAADPGTGRRGRPTAPVIGAPSDGGQQGPGQGEGSDNGAGRRRSQRVTTPVGQRPVPPSSNGGDYLYWPPAVEVPVPPTLPNPPEAPVPPQAPDVTVHPVLAPPPVSAPSPPPTRGEPHDTSAAGTYQAAFADIERGWTRRNLALLRRHVRDGDTKLSVSLGGRYAYSLTSRDFLSLTRTAFRNLRTLSFGFTRLRRAKNGDVTAYGRHIYRTPTGAVKAVFVSYTLRHQRTRWVIIGVGSSQTPLVK